jgi:glycosyltransferase involved in cell wall biosynthesis
MTVQLRWAVQCRFRPAPFVYVRAHFLALPTAALARVAGSIVVQEMNGPLDDAFDSWPQLRRLRSLLSLSLRVQLRWADAVITVTPGLSGYLAELTGRHHGYHVVGNGADVDRFVPAVSPAPSDRRPYVVFVGALASWQGIDVVLRATESDSWPPGVDLVVAGDGRERERVRAAAKASRRIHWLGTVPYEQTPGLVSGSLAALVPMVDAPRSRFGLSPLKLFEAMACGVPVVASDLPALGDVVWEHACGVTFRAGDADALALAVAELAEDPSRASEMGARGRTAAVAHYSWDARAGQTEQVLLAATRAPSPGGGSVEPARRSK